MFQNSWHMNYRWKFRLPGRGQSTISISSPVHGLPPFVGGKQVRVRFLIPPIHVSLHWVNSVHSDHFPSTGKNSWKNQKMINTWITIRDARWTLNKINHIPGHGLELHSRVSSLVTGHSFPPSLGLVRIFRVLFWDPESHFLLQVLQPLHSDILQSTTWKEIMNKWITIQKENLFRLYFSRMSTNRWLWFNLPGRRHGFEKQDCRLLSFPTHDFPPFSASLSLFLFETL